MRFHENGPLSHSGLILDYDIHYRPLGPEFFSPQAYYDYSMYQNLQHNDSLSDRNPISFWHPSYVIS
jgi:hypothetical protein